MQVDIELYTVCLSIDAWKIDWLFFGSDSGWKIRNKQSLTLQLWRLSVPLSLHVLFLKSVKSCSVYQVTNLWESVFHCKYYYGMFKAYLNILSACPTHAFILFNDSLHVFSIWFVFFFFTSFLCVGCVYLARSKYMHPIMCIALFIAFHLNVLFLWR